MSRKKFYSPSFLIAGLFLGLLVLLLCILASILLGVANINSETVIRSLMSFKGEIGNASIEELIVNTVRVPRTLTALLVGSSMAVAGAIMQGLTRNPLADPGILGINAGAAIAVVSSVFWLGTTSLSTYAGFAFLGAAMSAFTVYALGSLGRGGLTPLNLTIAGAAITAMVSSLTMGLLILNQRTLEEIRFWLAGSVAGRDMSLLQQVFPYLAIGLIVALLLGRQLTALSLGEEISQGLGQKTLQVKLIAGMSVILLAGGSVAIAGPIGFVGLIVPHVIRSWVGADYRWILPYTAIAGAILVIIADIVARLVIQPQELPVGLIMPLLGAPFFIYVTKSQIRG